MRAIISRLSRAIFACLLIALSGTGYAQTITGTIVGVVTDPSGAAVVDAEITLTNASTGAQRKTKSLESGDFVFSAIDPGRYDVTVTAPGFRPWSAPG
jgi:hypothetical protein